MHQEHTARMDGDTAGRDHRPLLMTQTEELQRAASALLLPLRVAAWGVRPFQATVESTGSATVRMGRVRSSPHAVRRGAGVMSSTDPDLFKVTLHRRGTGLVSQNDRQRQVRSGDLLVLDTTRPYTLILPDECDVMVLGLRRELLGPHARILVQRSGTSVPTDSGIRALCAAVLSSAGDHLDALGSPRSASYMSDALTSMLISTLADAPPEHVEMPTTSLLDRIVAYTLANLHDSGLSPQGIADRHGISLRRLHQLFRGQERTFCAWVRYERLLRIRRALSDPVLCHRSTAAIAASWGIQDTAHLARALKAEFGCTVAELRRNVGQAHQVAAAERMGSAD
ncbi:helix-turn-helix domain-containing protein [Streptomyces sp. NPDC056486]|uniref:AraC-like ligand-binding domain-containing protein n=1 Tax=Streptomyces sp. NPDC056486 TaxID=3345835 RepID=UPI003691E605